MTWLELILIRVPFLIEDHPVKFINSDYFFINATTVKILFNIECTSDDNLNITIRSQNECQTTPFLVYGITINSTIKTVEFETDLIYELTNYYIYMLLNDVPFGKPCTFQSPERPFNDQVVQKSNFHIDDKKRLYLYLQDEVNCRGGTFDYHYNYQIETSYNFTIITRQEGLIVYKKLKSGKRNDTLITIKAIDSQGNLRDGKQFIIPKLNNILKEPTAQAKVTANTYELSWNAVNVTSEDITSFVVYWCVKKELDNYNNCEGSIKSKTLKPTEFNYSIISNGDELRVGVAVNTEHSSSGFKFLE
ncbi:unnamed protein product [Diamesa serratosioi]